MVKKIIKVNDAPDLLKLIIATTILVIMSAFCGPLRHNALCAHSTSSFMHPLRLQRRNSDCILSLSYACLYYVKVWGIISLNFGKALKQASMATMLYLVSVYTENYLNIAQSNFGKIHMPYYLTFNEICIYWPGLYKTYLLRSH